MCELVIVVVLVFGLMGIMILFWSYGDYVICCGIGDLARAGGVISAVVVAGLGLIGLVVRGIRVRP